MGTSATLQNPPSPAFGKPPSPDVIYGRSLPIIDRGDVICGRTPTYVTAITLYINVVAMHNNNETPTHLIRETKNIIRIYN